MQSKTKLGELLVSKKLISEKELSLALKKQKKLGSKLGKVLIEEGYVSEASLLQVLSDQLNIPILDLNESGLNHEVAKLLPEAYARKYRALLLDRTNEGYVVGLSDPLDLNAIDEITGRLDDNIKWVLISESVLLKYLDIVYRRTDEITEIAEQLKEEFSENAEYSLSDLELDRANVDAPVVRFLRSVFEDAMQVGASDIHLEPDKEVLRIRLRINGLLQEHIVKEKEIMSSIALRLKLIGGLNISERRVPQDGRFHLSTEKGVVDVRLSTLPTQYGESIVMRLLQQDADKLNLHKLGLPDDLLEIMHEMIHYPNGIILVTGPTGSGKSTTLYSALNLLNVPEKKIITVEDPIEYQLPRVNQVQINEKIGLTFAAVLRSVLRQDPDIVLVGEMRDEVTAEIAIRAALTGHLVFSTLHTNDAPSTALRLLDMNLDGFLLAATLRGVLAQRLVRTICEHCKKDYSLSTFEKQWCEEQLGQAITTEKFYKGNGCSVCNFSGYSGRMGVFELLQFDEEMAEALRAENPDLFMQHAKTNLKGKTLVDNTLKLAIQGKTSIQEAMALAGKERENA